MLLERKEKEAADTLTELKSVETVKSSTKI